MKTVSLTRVVSGHDDTTIKIDPSHGFAVGAYFTDDGAALDLCMVLTAFGSFKVRGTVEEVSAALESATAPPVAAAVASSDEAESATAPSVAAAVASSDEAESAAMVLDLLADAAAQRDLGFVDGGAVDDVIGASGADWDSTEAALRALAAKLRGGG